jgi:UDP-2-acetamido-2-deoxy-ribo-hexuluronate aminotransferase
MEAGNFIQGKEVQDFASALSEYTGSAFTIPCANGTDALQLAYMALDLKPGDEILVPSFNYVAAAEAAVLLGIHPVFCDVEQGSFNLDPTKLEEKIGPKTKAIVAVHLFGQGCALEQLMAICNRHGLYLIEDNAQAIGAEMSSGTYAGKKLGTIGTIGTTSFFPSKNLGAMGDGGAVFCQDASLAAKIKMAANHGQRVKYQYETIGVNSRLDTIQAAILQVKLRHLPAFTAARQEAANVYDILLADLPGVLLPERVGYSSHVFHQYTLTFLEPLVRDKVKEGLEKRGIQSMIYYPKPLHLHSAYLRFSPELWALPVSEWLSQRVLSLPMHTELSREIQERIVGGIVESIAEIS